MKFIIKKEELLRAVSLVGRLATTRATLPILQNIFIQLKDNNLELRATDLEQTIQFNTTCEGSEDGSITASARILLDYLQNNTDTTITLSTNDTTIKIDSTNHKATIKGMAPEEFPNLPKITFQSETSISSADLIEAINEVIFAAANDETRPILTGLLFRFQDKKLQIVATDGYRLAKTVINIKNSLTGDFILPKRSLAEILRLLAQGDEVIMSFSNSQVQIKISNITFTSRVLDGSFPAFEAIIPKDHKISLDLNSANLLQTLKLASLFSRDSAYSTKFDIQKNNLKVTAVSPTLGENSNEITVKNSTDDGFSISANAQYLIDALQVLSGDISLRFIDAKSPIVVNSPANKEYLYLVMPLRSE